MLFNSLAFLIFFALIVWGYFLLPHRFRWMFLLAGSMYFYAAFVPKYLFILFAIIIVDYAAGILIGRSTGKKKLVWLLASIASNVGILVTFKYVNFFVDNVQAIASAFHLNYAFPHLALILPIGLSFHTFQSLSYVVEVYRGNQKAERHFGIYALYVMFFPQLVAGPIERPQNLLHQFREPHVFDSARTSSGLRRMLYGYFKKMVVADNAALIANHVFNQPNNKEPLTLVIGTVMFAFQIYGDFSGYSDIAIGSARILGFRLMENFNRPYFATSIADFWRRWHISLTTWFRDYVYIPLGGNRVGKFKQARNTLAVFLLSGFWHGASWTFVVWGALNGAYLVFSSSTSAVRKKLATVIRLTRWPKIHATAQWMLTFALVCLGWIFFRANTIEEAMLIIQSIVSGIRGIPSLTISAIQYRILSEGQIGVGKMVFIQICVSILALFTIDYATRDRSYLDAFLKKPAVIRWAAYYAVVLAILLFGYVGHQPFIYFQF